MRQLSNGPTIRGNPPSKYGVIQRASSLGRYHLPIKGGGGPCRKKERLKGPPQVCFFPKRYGGCVGDRVGFGYLGGLLWAGIAPGKSSGLSLFLLLLTIRSWMRTNKELDKRGGLSKGMLCNRVRWYGSWWGRDKIETNLCWITQRLVRTSWKGMWPINRQRKHFELEISPLCLGDHASALQFVCTSLLKQIEVSQNDYMLRL